MWGSCFSLGSRRSPPFAAAPPHSSLTHSPFAQSLRTSLLRGRRSTQSFLAELAARWPPLARGCLLPGRQPYTDTEPGVAGAIHRAPLLITNPHSSTSDRSTSHHNSSHPNSSHPNSSQFHLSHLTSHSSLITSQLLITPYHNLSHHRSTSHTPSHTSLITSELITAPLLTPDITSPLLTPHFSPPRSSH